MAFARADTSLKDGKGAYIVAAELRVPSPQLRAQERLLSSGGGWLICFFPVECWRISKSWFWCKPGNHIYMCNPHLIHSRCEVRNPKPKTTIGRDTGGKLAKMGERTIPRILCSIAFGWEPRRPESLTANDRFQWLCFIASRMIKMVLNDEKSKKVSIRTFRVWNSEWLWDGMTTLSQPFFKPKKIFCILSSSSDVNFKNIENHADSLCIVAHLESGLEIQQKLVPLRLLRYVGADDCFETSDNMNILF